MSLPSRGAWIEIFTSFLIRVKNLSRSPRGERGLKFDSGQKFNLPDLSLPSRGAWIEILWSHKKSITRQRRSPRGERGLKLLRVPRVSVRLVSLPSRGAWIEIDGLVSGQKIIMVAPLAGSVD